MTVRFACGHQMPVKGDVEQKDLRCVCGETRVSRVDAPPPRVRGTCTSPLKKG